LEEFIVERDKFLAWNEIGDGVTADDIGDNEGVTRDERCSVETGSQEACQMN